MGGHFFAMFYFWVYNLFNIIVEKIIDLPKMPDLIQIIQDFYLPVLISIPLSFLLYLLFHKYRHWILVNLGEHKWLIK